MPPLLGSTALALGVLLLLHAAFSGMHYKSLARELYGEGSALQETLPADVRARYCRAPPASRAAPPPLLAHGPRAPPLPLPAPPRRSH